MWNVTFEQESKQAVIYVRTPYNKDFLKVDNQIFQLHIYTTGVTMVTSLFNWIQSLIYCGLRMQSCFYWTQVQNISSNNFLQMSMTHLQKRAKYSVRVRAIPYVYLQGTWSDWSKTFRFFTPGGENQQQIHPETSLGQ